MDKWIERIKGLRKWSIMILIICIGVTFRVMSLINGVEFVALIKGVGVAFMASNAVEYVKDVVVSKIEGKKEDMSED